jgi:anaerobic selenocysteine-containing dehydrogenase
MVVFMDAADIAELGFRAEEYVDLTSAIKDGVERVARGFRIVPYAIPKGCIGAYYPEANALIPLSHHDRQARTPAYKATPVRLTPSTVSQTPQPERMRP